MKIINLFKPNRYFELFSRLHYYNQNFNNLARSLQNEISENNKHKLLKIKNIYSGEKCFIVGNGSSLKNQNLSHLANELCFVSNWFGLNDVYKELKQPFYFFGDPHFLYKKKIIPELVDVITSNPNAVLFTDLNYALQVSLEEKLESIQKYFLQVDLETLAWEGNFHADILNPLYWARSVVIDFCIPVAIFMGFKKIYLIGCDCDYNNGGFQKSYFYDLDSLPKSDRDNLKKLEKKDPPSAFMYTFERSFSAVREYTEKNGIIVQNATHGGKLEVFQRVDYASFF